MKKALLIFSSVITMMFVSADIHAQGNAKEIRVLVENPGSDKVFKDKEKKQLDFTVQGLEDLASVTEFTNRVKGFEGVKSFHVSDKAVNGGRTAHIEFHDTYSDNYFQKLLAYSKVNMLVVNGKRKPVRSSENKN